MLEIKNPRAPDTMNMQPSAFVGKGKALLANKQGSLPGPREYLIPPKAMKLSRGVAPFVLLLFISSRRGGDKLSVLFPLTFPLLLYSGIKRFSLLPLSPNYNSYKQIKIIFPLYEHFTGEIVVL